MTEQEDRAAANSAAADRYPEARAVLWEAETAVRGRNAPIKPNGEDPRAAIAREYARAGYIEDARKVPGGDHWAVFRIVNAQVIYGDLAGARRTAMSQRDAAERTMLLISIAHLTWQMRRKEQAWTLLDEAQTAAATIADPVERQKQIKQIESRRGYFRDDSPVLLTAEPHPISKPFAAGDSGLPQFPMTPTGFRLRSFMAGQAVPKGDLAAGQARADAAYLTELYAFVVARDEAGLRAHTLRAATPFQKALGLASLVHLLMQVKNLALAQEFAGSMPEDQADCSLAKAETLTAVGEAWAKSGELSRARQSFQQAFALLPKVTAGPVAYGRCLVAGRLGAAQDESGFAEDAELSYQLGLTSAASLPPLPRRPKYTGPPIADTEPYRELFKSALAAGNEVAARRIAQTWRARGGVAEERNIADAWYAASGAKNALAYARGIADPWERAAVLVWIAHDLLDDAGAPSGY